MARWANEDTYNALLSAASAKYRVPVALLKAIIGQESGFSASAYRAEPQIGDASRGLMQILLKTAQSMGYKGTADGLFDAATNIEWGTRYFADLLNNAASHGYGLDSAVSAYNAGSSGDRAGDGKRSTTRKDGMNADGTTRAPFVNQPYVNTILANYEYFKGKGTTTPVGLPSVNVTAARTDWMPWVLGGAAVLLFLVTFRQED